MDAKERNNKAAAGGRDVAGTGISYNKEMIRWFR